MVQVKKMANFWSCKVMIELMAMGIGTLFKAPVIPSAGW